MPKKIIGQCGTCSFAAEFCYCSTPSGPEDGVHCKSLAQARMMDSQTHGDAGAVAEFNEYGFLDLWRLELMAEDSHVCPNWHAIEGDSDFKLVEEPDA